MLLQDETGTADVLGLDVPRGATAVAGTNQRPHQPAAVSHCAACDSSDITSSSPSSSGSSMASTALLPNASASTAVSDILASDMWSLPQPPLQQQQQQQPGTVALRQQSCSSLYRGYSASAALAREALLLDLTCPLCMELMQAAVQLRPCGHSFCATCLSQHLGAQLEGGVPLTCPAGSSCFNPFRAVVNYSARLRLLRLPDNKRWRPGQQQSALTQAGAQQQENQQQQQGGFRMRLAGTIAQPGSQPSRLPPALSAADGYGIPQDPNTCFLNWLAREAAVDLLGGEPGQEPPPMQVRQPGAAAQRQTGAAEQRLHCGDTEPSGHHRPVQLQRRHWQASGGQGQRMEQQEQQQQRWRQQQRREGLAGAWGRRARRPHSDASSTADCSSPSISGSDSGGGNTNDSCYDYKDGGRGSDCSGSGSCSSRGSDGLPFVPLFRACSSPDTSPPDTPPYTPSQHAASFLRPARAHSSAAADAPRTSRSWRPQSLHGALPADIDTVVSPSRTADWAFSNDDRDEAHSHSPDSPLGADLALFDGAVSAATPTAVHDTAAAAACDSPASSLFGAAAYHTPPSAVCSAPSGPGGPARPPAPRHRTRCRSASRSPSQDSRPASPHLQQHNPLHASTLGGAGGDDGGLAAARSLPNPILVGRRGRSAALEATAGAVMAQGDDDVAGCPWTALYVAAGRDSSGVCSSLGVFDAAAQQAQQAQSEMDNSTLTRHQSGQQPGADGAVASPGRRSSLVPGTRAPQQQQQELPSRWADSPSRAQGSEQGSLSGCCSPVHPVLVRGSLRPRLLSFLSPQRQTGDAALAPHLGTSGLHGVPAQAAGDDYDESKEAAGCQSVTRSLLTANRRHLSRHGQANSDTTALSQGQGQGQHPQQQNCPSEGGSVAGPAEGASGSVGVAHSRRASVDVWCQLPPISSLHRASSQPQPAAPLQSRSVLSRLQQASSSARPTCLHHQPRHLRQVQGQGYASDNDSTRSHGHASDRSSAAGGAMPSELPELSSLRPATCGQQGGLGPWERTLDSRRQSFDTRSCLSSGSDDEEAPATDRCMSLLCPLHDDVLPLELDELKVNQIDNCVAVLRHQMVAARAIATTAAAATSATSATGTSSATAASPAAAPNIGRSTTPELREALSQGPTRPRQPPHKDKQEAALPELPEPLIVSCAVALESLCRLCWNDDEARETLAAAGGARLVVEVMTVMRRHAGVQVLCCLALMGLVRGEGELCQGNQWGIAKVGGVEAITWAMEHFRDSLAVQLAAVLCLIPLTLDNCMMQAHLSRHVILPVLRALSGWPLEAALQTKGLVLLGVMVEGVEPLQEAVRQRLLEEGVVSRVTAALSALAPVSDDVLWACLYCLAGLVREPPPNPLPPARLASQQVLRQALAAGALPVMQRCLAAHLQRVEGAEGAADSDRKWQGVEGRRSSDDSPADGMIRGAGSYLVELLKAEEAVVQRHRQIAKRSVTAAAVAVVLVTGGAWWWLSVRPGVGAAEVQRS